MDIYVDKLQIVEIVNKPKMSSGHDEIQTKIIKHSNFHIRQFHFVNSNSVSFFTHYFLPWVGTLNILYSKLTINSNFRIDPLSARYHITINIYYKQIIRNKSCTYQTKNSKGYSIFFNLQKRKNWKIINLF